MQFVQVTDLPKYAYVKASLKRLTSHIGQV